jgi:hypothetical protein
MNQYEVINTRHTLITGTHHLCEILLSKYGKCAALKSIRCYFLTEAAHHHEIYITSYTMLLN